MRKSIFKFVLFFLVCSSAAAKNPLYKLPETLPSKESSSKDKTPILVGTDNGLYSVQSNGSAVNLWNGGKINRIVKTPSKWFFATDNGLLASSDLQVFSEINNGLPVLTIKEYDGTNKTFKKQVHPLKDLAVDPLDENILATSTKDAIYLSRDGGKSWKNIGSSSAYSSGNKAVAVAHMPVYENGVITKSEVVVMLSHPIYGYAYYRADAANPAWIDVSAGFGIKESLTQVDELSDILCVPQKSENGIDYCDVYVAGSFIPVLYKFNWQTKRAEELYRCTNDLDTIDSLYYAEGFIYFETMGKVCKYSVADKTAAELSGAEYTSWRKLTNSTASTPNCAYIPSGYTGTGRELNLCEMWMLDPDNVITPYAEKAADHKAIYVSPYFLITDAGIAKYKNIITSNKLDAIVVDMKDDYGMLRFKNPQSPLLQEKGKCSSYTVDLDHFVPEFKKDNIYLIARIVVFKDRHLSEYDGGKYAIWDTKNNTAWRGLKKNGTYYDENWVDPYCQEVWEYDIEIAKELINRGFDEIQFDYIRFPTDGTNKSDWSYRWQDPGMDKESAIVSFLSYARKNINAPIGTDIYGANGWYRTGSGTGQDVELMKDYVDVICPMFYPSHFEQNFLTYSPYEERPYRIYFYGSYRNTAISHNRVIVRPWVQAFKLGVSYDNNYYNNDYVKREIYGVRDGLNRGYMYWNNSGRYDDICVDPSPDQKSPWYANEGALQQRIPAFSAGSDVSQFKPEFGGDWAAKQKSHSEDMNEVLATVRNSEVEDTEENPSEKKSSNSYAATATASLSSAVKK